MDFTFPVLNTSSMQEKIMTKENGLRQWREGENIFIHVEKPMKEVLLVSKTYSFFYYAKAITLHSITSVCVCVCMTYINV